MISLKVITQEITRKSVTDYCASKIFKHRDTQQLKFIKMVHTYVPSGLSLASSQVLGSKSQNTCASLCKINLNRFNRKLLMLKNLQ